MRNLTLPLLPPKYTICMNNPIQEPSEAAQGFRAHAASSVAAKQLGAAMAYAHEKLGQQRYDALCTLLAEMAEKDQDGNFTTEAMVRLTRALRTCTDVVTGEADARPTV